ncbi:hypothetical protein MRB53_041237 [Persea americana]|nr:hypothetical protein MRB53_041237 [Persea americana]
MHAAFREDIRLRGVMLVLSIEKRISSYIRYSTMIKHDIHSHASSKAVKKPNAAILKTRQPAQSLDSNTSSGQLLTLHHLTAAALSYSFSNLPGHKFLFTLSKLLDYCFQLKSTISGQGISIRTKTCLARSIDWVVLSAYDQTLPLHNFLFWVQRRRKGRPFFLLASRFATTTTTSRTRPQVC